MKTITLAHADMEALERLVSLIPTASLETEAVGESICLSADSWKEDLDLVRHFIAPLGASLEKNEDGEFVSNFAFSDTLKNVTKEQFKALKKAIREWNYSVRHSEELTNHPDLGSMKASIREVTVDDELNFEGFTTFDVVIENDLSGYHKDFAEKESDRLGSDICHIFGDEPIEYWESDSIWNANDDMAWGTFRVATKFMK
jgi:hypothetical protein